jgi:phosphate transport system substrate-binding protein
MKKTLVALTMLAASSAPAGESPKASAANTQNVTNANKSIWTLDVTGFRKERGSIGGYTKTWDKSGMPKYEPRKKLSGTLRIWGSNYLKDGPLGGYWEEAFKKFHPDVKFEWNLPTAGIAIPAVAAKVADLGIGRPATLMDHLTFEQVFRYRITELNVATGSYDVYGWSAAYIILVNKDNPLTSISMKQLDGVFGTARQGGYDGSVWRNDYPYKRGAEENIRTWGQLGLTGEWADKPIQPCGQSPRANIQVVFQNMVLRGSDQWVEGYKAFANYATPDAKINPWSHQVRDELLNNKEAICIASPLSMAEGLRELEISDWDGGKPVKRSLESVHDRSYPLINEIFFFANKPPGKEIEPLANEFLHFVLSQEGQAEIEREGRYLPLTADLVNAQRAKLKADAN